MWDNPVFLVGGAKWPSGENIYIKVLYVLMWSVSTRNTAHYLMYGKGFREGKRESGSKEEGGRDGQREVENVKGTFGNGDRETMTERQ